MSSMKMFSIFLFYKPLKDQRREGGGGAFLLMGTLATMSADFSM